MINWSSVVIIVFAFFYTGSACAVQAHPPSDLPHNNAVKKTDISATGLENLESHFAKYVADGRIVGMTSLISQNGEIKHFKTYGFQDQEKGIKTKPDTIYRIYSMTKPVVAVALMQLR